MMKKRNYKILNHHGETIGEMLVSSLIIALAMVMLITMVNIAARLVKNSDDTRVELFSNINQEEQAEDSGTQSAKLEITGSDNTKKLNVKNGTNSNNNGLDIQVSKHLLSGNRYAITYEKASSQ